MRGRIDSGTSLVRAALLTSLSGHWIANALFDADQYEGAGPEVLGALSDPIWFQSAVVVGAAAALSARNKRRRGTASPMACGRSGLLAALVGLQLLLFLTMESTERLWIDLRFGDGPADVGLFGAGFVAELLVAVGIGIVLTFLSDATARLFDRLRASDAEQQGAAARILRPSWYALPRGLAGAGRVRAPPAGL